MKMVLPVLILIFVVLIYPQSRKVNKIPAHKTSIQATGQQPFLITGFDRSLEKLPLNFRGHDIRRIFSEINKLPLRKSEFESNADYRSRIEKFSNNLLFGEVSFDSLLALSVINLTNHFGPLKAEYDAEERKMSITIQAEYGFDAVYDLKDKMLKGDDLQSFIVSESVPRSLGSFIGVNSFGRRSKVSSGEFDRYKLVFSNCVGSRPSYISGTREKTTISTSRVEFKLDMETMDAIDLKYSPGMLLVGTLTFPYANAERSKYVSATIKSPIEIWVNTRFIFLNIDELWIYSTRTGKVFKKIPKCSLKSSDYDYSHFFF